MMVEGDVVVELLRPELHARPAPPGERGRLLQETIAHPLGLPGNSSSDHLQSPHNGPSQRLEWAAQNARIAK